MKEDDKPSPPPSEPIKPKPTNDNKPSFAFEELLLEFIEEINGVKYLAFRVSDKFIVSMPKFSYYEYLDNIFTLREEAQNEGKECICDICEPDFTEIPEADAKLHTFKITKNEQGDEEIDETTDNIPFYSIYNLVENTKVAFHPNHENTDSND